VIAGDPAAVEAGADQLFNAAQGLGNAGNAIDADAGQATAQWHGVAADNARGLLAELSEFSVMAAQICLQAAAALQEYAIELRAAQSDWSAASAEKSAAERHRDAVLTDGGLVTPSQLFGAAGAVDAADGAMTRAVARAATANTTAASRITALAGQLAEVLPPPPPPPAPASEDHGLVSTIVHTGLDGLGLVPVIGEPADGINAVYYAAEGDEVNAALSAAAMVPVAGTAATGAKLTRKTVQAADGAAATAAAAKKAYPRASGFRKGVRQKTWTDNVETSTGRVRDPVTGQFMSAEKKWDMGHKPGMELRKMQLSAHAQDISRQEWLDWHNNPSHYRPELPTSNRNHKGEDHSDGYWGP
jgi:hypothetical protein